MKVIFSRKLWDSASGGRANPIINGSLVTLPIPCESGSPTYASVSHPTLASLGFPNLADFINIYHPALLRKAQYCHVDPDLDTKSLAMRLSGWKPAFGQQGGAAGHLDNNQVNIGDLFLFYCWADDCTLTQKGRKVNGMDRYVIWGWLQVGAIHHSPTTHNTPDWLHHHPHIIHGTNYKNNRIYVAADKLLLNQKPYNPHGVVYAGGGILPYGIQRVLTKTPGRRGRYPDGIPNWHKVTKHRQEHVWQPSTATDFDFIDALLK